MSRKGTLYLVPTPISDEHALPVETLQALQAIAEKLHEDDGAIMLVEEARAARRRWLRFGLPREGIEHFFLYNEHNQKTAITELIGQLQKGRDLYLMSDCGLPAFCDPGRHLVWAAHQQNISVRSLPFANSVLLALALSGLPHERFEFLGFVPRQEEDTQRLLKEAFSRPKTYILMDTPYRAKKLLQQLAAVAEGCKALTNWNYFLGCDLLKPSEEHFYGSLDKLKAFLQDEKKSKLLFEQKKEFVLLISPS